MTESEKNKLFEYAEEIKKKLLRCGFRPEVDSRYEKIGFKIREAQLEKVPYMLVVGEDGSCDEGARYWGIACNAVFSGLELMYGIVTVSVSPPLMFSVLVGEIVVSLVVPEVSAMAVYRIVPV